MTLRSNISERRVLELIDAYGAVPARWPATERAPAMDLVARTPDLRIAMETAAVLDEMLDTRPTPMPNPALRVELKKIPDQRHGLDWLSALWPFGAPWRPAMGLAAALAVGLLVGAVSPPADTLTGDSAEIMLDQTAPSDPVTLAGLTAFGGGSDNGFGLTGFSTEGDL
ncbi:MAG: hypothetical protein NXI19_05760 [Alphaproteobacteria bacterium]|nr:hypothetical protein [Alphaproteobacteria bacterium]